ncbi:MAG: hypothetical protein U1E57_05730 [Paenacidovorax caeni]|jgi:hypothetical protein
MAKGLGNEKEGTTGQNNEGAQQQAAVMRARLGVSSFSYAQ